MKWIKRHAYVILFSSALLGANAYVLLKTFVLPSAVTTVAATQETSETQATGKVTQTDQSYQDDNISISIETKRQNDTTLYIADIQVSSPEYLKTALAQNTYGTNITETTSTIAQANQAIFAINGDYYGANQTGYVIKNGVLYRDSSRSSTDEDLVQYQDGHFEVVSEEDKTAQALLDSGVINTFTFGPTLIKDGKIAVSTSSEVGRAMADNPRTAIGIIDETHYIVIVSDGRTDESSGLTLYELAQVMQSYNVKLAYNLDGGGSSTMYFNGQVVNKPTTNGNQIQERGVSDIVYIGY